MVIEGRENCIAILTKPRTALHRLSGRHRILRGNAPAAGCASEEKEIFAVSKQALATWMRRACGGEADTHAGMLVSAGGAARMVCCPHPAPRHYYPELFLVDKVLINHETNHYIEPRAMRQILGAVCNSFWMRSLRGFSHPLPDPPPLRRGGGFKLQTRPRRCLQLSVIH